MVLKDSANFVFLLSVDLDQDRARSDFDDGTPKPITTLNSQINY